MIATARQHVITPLLLVILGLFPNEEVAARRCAKLEERGELRFCGFAALLPSMPKQKVYTSGWIAKNNQLDHELWLTISLFNLRPDAIERRAVNPELLPDAHIWFGDSEMFIELDMGTEKKPQVRRRLRKLAKRTTLWICHGNDPKRAEGRMHWLRELNRELAAPHLFTTTYKLMTMPREMWTSWQRLDVSADVS